ncbi:MAG: hypothetical protein Q9M28_11395 [Mariprofundaceae bacterium]|nr:hypothetical protein [Mariprofundaceae bacterium]
MKHRRCQAAADAMSELRSIARLVMMLNIVFVMMIKPPRLMTMTVAKSRQRSTVYEGID